MRSSSYDNGFGAYSEYGLYPEPGYTEIRTALSKAYRRLPPEKIEQIVRESIGEVPPEYIEDFLGTLGQIGQVALPIVGGAVGTVIGGPIGGALGAAGGQAAAAAVGAATQPRPAPSAPPPRPAPSAPPPRPAPAAAPPPRPAPAAARAPATQQPTLRRPGTVPPRSATQPAAPAAAQLISLVLRPEFLQGLASLLFGSAGRQSIPVGGTSVPVGAFLNLLGVLADQAAAEHHASSPSYTESVPEYLIESDGEFKCDVTAPEQRAEVLWEMLQAETDDESAEAAPGYSDWQAWEMMHDQILDEYDFALAYTKD